MKMSKVNVQKIRQADQPHPLLQKTIDLVERVRTRAFELFEKRGAVPGNELDDWLQAEKEIFDVPDMEIAEHEAEFELHLAWPGFQAKNIRVAALPDMAIVVGEAAHQHSHTNGAGDFCEHSERRVFRQIPLPGPVDVDHVSATFDKEVLQVRVAKARQEKRKAAGA
jgi:HSP20 family molecular chaperone IbpA